jgi:predicted nucleic acid-binding protein
MGGRTPFTLVSDTPASTSGVLFDAGLFIGALLVGDPRHEEAEPLVEAARAGTLPACTTPAILGEVYAALTWQGALPPHTPAEAYDAVAALVEAPSHIEVLPETLEAVLLGLQLARAHNLTARSVHDARHAACALMHSGEGVYTYDFNDWRAFAPDGMQVLGPPSTIARIAP